MTEWAKFEEGPRLERISHITSLAEAISFLKQPVAEEEPPTIKIFEIDPKTHPIESDQLQRLTSFPIEFSLHEEKGKIVVATGDKEGPALPARLNISPDTCLYAHTHPQSSINTFLSFLDIYTSADFGPRAQLILITKEGIVVYKRPQWDPLRNTSTDEEPRELMLEWGEQRKIDFLFFRSKPPEGMRSFFDLSDTEILEALRNFAKDTQMIVIEAQWGSQEATKILDALNFKTTISNNEVVNPPSVLETNQHSYRLPESVK